MIVADFRTYLIIYYIEYNSYLCMGCNSFLNMGRKSLAIDYKSLFTKNLKIMSFTFKLQNYEKNSEKPNSF